MSSVPSESSEPFDDADQRASAPRELIRLLRHHPRYLPERLMTFAGQRLGEPIQKWAIERLREGPEAVEAEHERLRQQTIVLSRVDGAVAGTPFFIALVPAYVSFLWAQARMVMQMAALRGRDTTDPEMVVELLTLRGVYATKDEARAGLARVDDDPPEQGGRRERFAGWVTLVQRVLVLAAFSSPSDPDQRRSRVSTAIALTGAGVIWMITCVLPLTFMILLSWNCESSTRKLASLAEDYYAPGLSRDRRRIDRQRIQPDKGHDRRRLIRSGLLAISMAIPLTFVALGVSRLSHDYRWLTIVGSFAGLALVLALTVGRRV